jgi:hypothetical protein
MREMYGTLGYPSFGVGLHRFSLHPFGLEVQKEGIDRTSEANNSSPKETKEKEDKEESKFKVIDNE